MFKFFKTDEEKADGWIELNDSKRGKFFIGIMKEKISEEKI